MTPFGEDIRFGRWLRDPIGVWFYQSASGFLRAALRGGLFDPSKADPLWGITVAATMKTEPQNR